MYRPLDASRPAAAAVVVDPLLESLLRHAIAIGVVLLLLVPAARGHHPQLGWLPLWLLAMPLTAWWALHRFRWPRRTQATPLRAARRRCEPQARRRASQPARRIDSTRTA